MDPRRQAAIEEERHWRRIACPMPARREAVPYEETFTLEESARLRRCVLPQVMEDKWIVLFDDLDTSLSFHRSWTGYLVYRVTLVSIDEDADPSRLCATELVVNRDPSQYAGTDDALDAARVSWLIRTLLLDQAVAMPEAPSLSPDDALLEAWSFAGAAGFSPAEGEPPTGNDEASEGGPPSERGEPDEPPRFLHGL